MLDFSVSAINKQRFCTAKLFQNMKHKKKLNLRNIKTLEFQECIGNTSLDILIHWRGKFAVMKIYY